MGQGDFEADTIVGFNRKSGLLTLVDRKSRYLIAAKLSRLGSIEVRDALIECLQGQNALSDADLQAVVDQLNNRPRKILGYRKPAELYFSTMLHLA